MRVRVSSRKRDGYKSFSEFGVYEPRYFPSLMLVGVVLAIYVFFKFY